MGFLKSWSTALISLLMGSKTVAFNAPPDVPAWCGKPYMSSNQALDPGGQFQYPTPQPNALLYLTIQPRYSIYLDNDDTGSFIIDATISHIFGQPYKNVSNDIPNQEAGSPFTTLNYSITSSETSHLTLISSTIPINSSDNLVHFPISSFTPRLTPYPITISASSPDGRQLYNSSTQLYILPSRTYGSAVRIDNLHGSLSIQNPASNYTWTPIFPNGHYVDGSIVTPSIFTLAPLNTYALLGYNTINIVPDGGTPDQSYPTASLSKYWDRMDELNLYNIYDMRFAYQNSTRISTQVELWKNRETLLMYYTADEPDGWMYPLNSTSLAYNQLRALDPYHPISLVLNCQNFYYADYAAGADIIFQDAYPVGINATNSILWDNIPCNTTYGDCGCDNCVGSLTDVSSRLDDIQEYQSLLLGASGANGATGGRKKPTWSVLQAFGSQDYWNRVPTAAEVESMMMLSINHDAKGLTYWIYPSTLAINNVTGALGRVLMGDVAMGFLFGGYVEKGLVVKVGGEARGKVDASAWVVGGKMMVGFACLEYGGVTGEVEVVLPRGVKGGVGVLYGGGGDGENWTVSGSGMSMVKLGLKGLEVGLLVLELS